MQTITEGHQAQTQHFCPLCGGVLVAKDFLSAAFPGSLPFWRLVCKSCGAYGQPDDRKDQCKVDLEYFQKSR